MTALAASLVKRWVKPASLAVQCALFGKKSVPTVYALEHLVLNLKRLFVILVPIFAFGLLVCLVAIVFRFSKGVFWWLGGLVDHSREFVQV